MDFRIRRKDLRKALGATLEAFDSRLSSLENKVKGMNDKKTKKKSSSSKAKKAIVLLLTGLFMFTSTVAPAKIINRGVDVNADIDFSKIDISVDPENSAYTNGNKYLVLPTIATPPSAAAANKGSIYYDTDDDTVYSSDGSSWSQITASAGSLDGSYNSGSKINADTLAVEIEVADTSNNGALLLDMDDSTNNPDVLTITNAGTGNDITAPNFTLANGVLTATTATITTLYQSAIAAAASGNTNLTIDAAGTGTITLGGTSTGKIVTDNLLDLQGNVDIGNAATDTLTITSIIDSNVTLDDGTTDSPSLILQDATNETGTFVKVDGSHVTFTPNAAGQAFQILTGNLRVGNGSPGTASMNGEDAYIEGELEVDGAIQLDGALTAAGGISVADGDITNVGDIKVDTITADGASIVIGDGTETGAINTSDWGIDATGAMTNIGAITSDGAISTTSTFDVDGAANISDTTGGADVAIGNSTGNVTVISDNYDLTLTDATDNVFQLVNSGGAVLVDIDLGATDAINIGSGSENVVISSNEFGVSADGNVTTTGIVVGTPEEITATSAGVAASVTELNTEVTTNGDSDLDNVTLANGTSGQIKHIYCVVEGAGADTWKITPANMVGGTQITFDAAGEGCTLIFASTEGWIVVANTGGTIS